MKTVEKIEDSALWKNAMRIALDAYGVIEDLPKEEEWDMKTRLHQHAFTMTDNVAQAYGSLDPRDMKWSLGKARADLFAVKSAYILGYKANEIPEKSEIIVLINQSVEMLDKELEDVDTEIQQWYESLSDRTGQKK